ncbi:cobalt ECF transporter T component CbiQ [Methanobacterium formicicum]|uniref:Cobalt ABC transporter inner membrane subunit CbiQ n=1 Tax=Methanobacterium formicicum (strain DSM 3637 / PP1) TaxID=1204725 RepID=K2R9B4_METFP|nr:cobalt ECF transporter T component CbiQ [Methanobacterium formicicum]EKF84894.1 cobalt ABC transporter inner membrane subunit CbiQ [Methanobacterium formicicum DSM 3637]
MFENTLDNYAHSNGLRDINTLFKVLFGISTMLVSLISTSLVVPLLITICISFLIIFQAKIPWKFYLKFLTIPLTFGLFSFVFMSLFFGVGTHILDLGIFNLAVTEDGFNLGLLLFARVMGGFTCMAFLALTIPMTELFSELERIKIPQIITELAMLMYRYIFLFLDEGINMYHAQETRLGYSSYKKSFKSMGMLGSNLFIRTWVKGEQAHLAMESRCYDGSIKTMKEPESIKSIGILNISLLILFEACLIFVVYLTGSFTVI